jgi:hypothetical protein
MAVIIFFKINSEVELKVICSKNCQNSYYFHDVTLHTNRNGNILNNIHLMKTALGNMGKGAKTRWIDI